MADAPRVVALIDDLMFWMRVKDCFRAAGVDTARVKTGEELLTSLRETGARLAIVDLSCRSGDPVAAIALVRADPATAAVPVVAYGSHVEEALLAAASAAGAGSVLPRSAFARDLPAIARETALRTQ